MVARPMGVAVVIEEPFLSRITKGGLDVFDEVRF